MFNSSTGSQQDSMENNVIFELNGYTWQFDTNRLARVLSPKKRKFPLEPDQIDNLDAYIDNTIPNEVLQDAMKSFGRLLKFPHSGTESHHYEPLCKLLNKCVGACHIALGDSRGGYYRALKFVKWDNPTQDGCYGEHCLKPDLAGGLNLPEREEIKANGGLYWRPPSSNEHELFIPVEVKKGWKDLVFEAGTYARCLFMASPLRKFALVLGYEYDLRELRILLFHHGGLTSSKALKLNAKNGIKELLHIFLAILSWNTVVDAGLPLWCNDSRMILLGDKGPQTVQVKEVLYHTLALRGRCSRVLLVCEVDKSDKRNESKSIPALAPEGICAPPHHSAYTHSMTASNTNFMCNEATLSYYRYGNSFKSLYKNPGAKDKPTNKFFAYFLRWFCLRTGISEREDDNVESLAQLPVAIPQNDGRIVKEVTQNIIGSSSSLNFASPGIVIKCSWVSPADENIESELIHDGSGLFGIPKHYYSFLAYHGDESPATNHLFLPDDTEIDSCYWNLFRQDAASLRSPDRRGLWVYISSFAGHSLERARSPKMLIYAVFHACLGWFNLIQKGYFHRDISIGNVVMMENAVTTEPFGILKNDGWNATIDDMTQALQELKIDPSASAKATWENKLTAALHDLNITNECHGFVIDGDMAIKMADYFNREHLCSRTGTYQFMSDDILTAGLRGYDYLQSPIDDLFSFYYTMQWAAVFHDPGMAANYIPINLETLREDFLRNQSPRQSRLCATTEIINKITHETPLHVYGPFLASCQPVLRAWYLELWELWRVWRSCRYKLDGQEIKAEIYIHLFLTFAVRGVAILAEIVHEHAKDMD